MKKISWFPVATTLLLILLFIAILPIQAQQSDRQPTPVMINTDLVTTWAQVTNRNDGSPVKGLSINDFLLREEGKSQQIDMVKEGQLLSVVILVNGMDCLFPPEHQFQQSHEALRQLGVDTEIALMAWDSDVVLIQPFTKNHQPIADRLNDRMSFFETLNGTRTAIRPGRDWNRPGEAIYQAARYLERAASPERRKIIILISYTSADIFVAKTHPHTGAEVTELLKQTGATVYALLENTAMPSIYGSDEYNPFTMLQVIKKKRQRRGAGTLEEFVDLTGGSILVSKNEAWLNMISLIPNGEFGKEFDELFIRLTQMIRSSYTIGYYPENTKFDGRFRRIKLELSPSGKAKAGKVDIKTRDGHHAIRTASPPVVEVNSKQ